MEFLQSNWLWGMLAVAVPVAIHFWNQKKGITIDWAASRWLSDKNTLNHRGIQLHEIPLMLLRCLLLILLAVILGKPVLNWLNDGSGFTTVHLVQPDKLLVDNYRFELEEALKKEEKIYWVGPETEEMTALSHVPVSGKSESYLQQSVNKISGNSAKIKMYIVADQQLATFPKVYVPASFEVYSVIDSSHRKDARLKFDKTLNVLVDYKNQTERETIEAALAALSEVHKIPFSVDLKVNAGTKYDWILTDNMAKPIDSQTLYTVSGKVTDPALPANVFQIPDSLKLASSDIVENGRLPELLGEKLMEYYGLVETGGPLSSSQLHAMFVQTKPLLDAEANQMRKWLLLFFVLTALLERWISLRKNRVSAYA